jgi:hypothetical protein
MEEHWHFGWSLARMQESIVAELSLRLEVRNSGRGLSLGVAVQDNLKGNALSHQRDLEKLMSQVHAHDLCICCKKTRQQNQAITKDRHHLDPKGARTCPENQRAKMVRGNKKTQATVGKDSQALTVNSYSSQT